MSADEAGTPGKPTGRKDRRPRPRAAQDLHAVLQRQIERYRPLIEETAGDWGPAESSASLNEEQLAEMRTQLERLLGPDRARLLLESFDGPLRDDVLAALDSIPEGMPATRDEFIAGHEMMRRMVGDLRPSAEPAQPGATGRGIHDSAHQGAGGTTQPVRRRPRRGSHEV